MAQLIVTAMVELVVHTVNSKLGTFLFFVVFPKTHVLIEICTSDLIFSICSCMFLTLQEINVFFKLRITIGNDEVC